MEKGKSSMTYILVGILIIVGAFWAYQQYSSQSVEEPAGVTVTSGGNGDVVADDGMSQADQFVKILQNIDSVTLANRSLLADKIFTTQLQDFGKEIEDRPKGRSNPFAPIGLGNQTVETQTVPSDTTTNTPEVSPE